MNENIALVLPAFNEEKGLEKSLLNIKKGIELFPEYNFTLFPIDDGSKDNTYEAILHFVKVYDLNTEPSRNEINIGVAQTLKRKYAEVIKTNNDIILKTDLDSDFDQKIVLDRLLLYVKTNHPIVAGVRWREITREENSYEVDRRDDILRIFEEELGVTELDPPSIGSQFYRRNYLDILLNQPIVQRYDKRWGFELLLDLVSARLGVKPPVVKIEKGQYDPARRPVEKVDAQYNAYLEIIAELTDKNPEDLSKFYIKE